ncbi:MAG: hypothetical protein E7638_03225 [Ruminococcaceae bacterium]|nr:hypothetical protein [Oscillospiraceae bacterium]
MVKMQKKISVGAAIGIAAAAVLVGAVMTFQVSYVTLQDQFEEKYLTELKDPSAEKEPVRVIEKNYSEFITNVADKLSEVDAIYRDNYLGELDNEVLMDSIMEGYVYGTGDEYAAYYSDEDFLALMSDLEGEMTGVGISVIYNTEYNVIEVLNVMPDSPALEAGVKIGDLIITVGEEKESVSALGYYPAVNKMQGEAGTEAVFTVARGENYEETVDFRITRAKVTELTVMYHVYEPDNTVGVIKITGFDSKTPEQFVEAVSELGMQGCEKLVVDLRYNPGGELNSILSILDFLVPEGPIIRIFDKDNNEVEAYYSEADELDVPIAVLVNGSTASAAELFTSTLRDYNKATIVGTTTYGKGCMQTTMALSDYSAVSVTFRMYNPPFSENYHGVGIVPDVVVELDEAVADKNIYKITDAEDNQLAAAVATFYEKAE